MIESSSESLGKLSHPGKERERRSSLYAFFTRPSVLVALVVFIGFIYHPKWMNFRFYFGKGEELIPMNYVSNFFLWTRSNRDNPETVVVGSTDKLLHSYIRPRKTYILIHGFTRTGLESWIINMKNALLWREDCNVISVDWEAGSMTASYYVIQARVPVVGEDVAKLIQFLGSQAKLGGSPFHVIGHSLGAHVAGFAGKSLNGSLQRITGLDPAGLSYNGMDGESRLDKSDAEFVDVIHTHGCYSFINQWTDCYGTYDNMGDADFWPNGGHHQPACDEEGDGRGAVREGSNCNHGLAYVYFTESIMSYPTSTRFLARECPSYELYNNGSCPCSPVPQYMGFNVNPQVKGVFYLNTSSLKPYGILDPSCSPAQYSFMKILGYVVCIHLVLFGLMYCTLLLLSALMKKDLMESMKLKCKQLVEEYLLKKNQ